jgi:carbon monoxide dehydrogenase subunit G
MSDEVRADGRQNPLYRMLHPTRVGDVVEVRHAIPGRLRLGLRRSDSPCVDAVVTALVRKGGSLERTGGGPAASLVVRYDPAATSQEQLLAAPLAALPMPPPRLGAAADVAGPATAVWAALTAEEGPPWCPPAMLQVTPLAGTPPAWDIAVKVGPWTLPHCMVTTAEEPPHLLELSITGKLNGMIRYEVAETAPGRSRLTQALWFAIDGNAAEVTMGEGIVQQFARRFAEEQVRDIARKVEGGAGG